MNASHSTPQSSTRLCRWLSAAILISCCLLTTPCGARSYYVRQSGNDSQTGTSRSQAFRTIAHVCTVAGPGDIVYVGAGTYRESALINGPNNPNLTSWLVFIADSRGWFTGDSGQIVIEARADHWAIRIQNSTNVLFHGFGFRSETGHASTTKGCLSTNSSGTTTYSYCDFDRLRHAIRGTGSHRQLIYRCTFTNTDYAVHTAGAVGTDISLCRFLGNRYGCVAVNGGPMNVLRSVFYDRVNSNSDVVDGIGVYARSNEISVRNCLFEQVRSGVYASKMTSAVIEECRFNGTTQQAINFSGAAMRVASSTIDVGKYGIIYSLPDDQSAVFKDTQITQTRYAIVAQSGDAQWDNVRLIDNTYAVRQRSSCRSLTIDNEDHFVIQGNDYGIVSNHHAETGGQLSVEGVDFSGNQRGVIGYHSQTDLSNCQFAGEKLGVYLRHSVQANVSNCDFSGNPDAPRDCTYGLYVHGADVTVHNSQFENSRYGILIENTSDRPPRLTDNVSQNHSTAALYLKGGNWTYTDSDRNRFENSPRGVMARNVNWVIKDMITSNTCQYPIMDYGGRCQIENVTVTGLHTGVYSYQSQSLSATKLTVKNSPSYGVRIHHCPSVTFRDCLFTQNGHGVYLRTDQSHDPTFTNCQFTHNANHGLMLRGATLASDPNLNLTFTNNRYGLRVIQRPLVLNDKMKVVIDDNEYGLVVTGNRLSMTDFNMSGNANGVYCDNGALRMTNCQIDSTSRGVIANLVGECEIRSSQVHDASYGLILRARTTLETPVTVADVSIDGADRCGVYVINNSDNQTVFALRNVEVRDSRRGLSFRNSIVRADRIRCFQLSEAGIYQSGGTLMLTRSLIQNVPSSWAVIARGDRCSVSQTMIRDGKHGIALLTNQGTIVNTVVSGVQYGVYLRGSESQYKVMHTTVANCQSIGLVRIKGNAIVRNSIFQATRFGMYDGRKQGIFNHQYNLVSSPNRRYRNTVQGEGEIDGPAEFAAPIEGDFHLIAGSPAINSGMDLSGLISNDFDDNVRPSFEGYEMGAYEFMEPSGSLRVLNWKEVAK